MSTTFISCVFQYDEAYLEKWIDSKLHMLLYVSSNDYASVTEKIRNTNISCQPLPNLKEETSWFKSDIQKLPATRNEEKDTVEHLWNMHMKVYATYKTAVINERKTAYFAYIDFDAPRLIAQDHTWKYLEETYQRFQLYLPEHEKRVYLPGCWDAANSGDLLKDEVHWRFCGSFFIGSTLAIYDFYKQYELHFSRFLEVCDNTLTWEMNFWAWLEASTHWKPVWYKADHNDTMVQIPKVFGYEVVHRREGSIVLEYGYPQLTPYRPMSAAYVEYNNKAYINTRFVNYWIYDNGCYYYPEDEQVIRTHNICSELVVSEGMLKPSTFAIMNEECNLPKKDGVFSEGIEDIRLYVSQETGKLCFIGSTLGYSYCDRIRMVRGTYELDTHTMKDIQLIKPHWESWCEKNWAPIPLGNKDGFVYKWFPLQIGRIIEDDDGDHEKYQEIHSLAKFEIVVSKPMDERFRHMKGSTAFTKYGDSGLIGVVHFSEERTPRQYFHRVIVLHCETFELMKCSPVFCFRKACVEFCIGFKENNGIWGFWISQMDRDPLYLEVASFWE